MATTYRVPTMGATTFLTDPGEIIKYQLRNYLAMPRSSSDVYYDSIRSYMDTVSRHQHNRDVFRAQVESDIEYVLKRVFYNDTAGVSVSVTTKDGPSGTMGYYVVILATVTIDGYLHSVSPDFVIVNGIPMMRNDQVSKIAITSSIYTTTT